MYQEKRASELKMGDDVLFEGEVPQQIIGTMTRRDKNGENVVTLYTVKGIKYVQHNQVFQVKVY